MFACTGGGLGGTRRGGADVNIKHSGREDNERERERYRLEQRDRDDRARHERPADRSGEWGPGTDRQTQGVGDADAEIDNLILIGVIFL